MILLKFIFLCISFKKLYINNLKSPLDIFFVIIIKVDNLLIYVITI